MNIRPLLDALDLQEDAARALADHLRAQIDTLGHELLPKNVEGTRAKLKRLVELGLLTEADTGNFARKQ
ncbi:hypothetical protein ACPC3D_16505 [Streptomyces cellulosae]